MHISKAVVILVLTALSIALGVAIYPEPPAKLLSLQDGWDVHGPASAKVPFFAFPEQSRQIRHSAIESPGGVLFRTWTPDEGIVPIEITSGRFHPARYMSVAITGANRTTEGKVHAVIQCEANGQQLDVFRGSVNNNVSESFIVSPEGWCPGEARMKFSATENNVHVGVGSVFEISYLSYLKSCFIGAVPYLIVSILFFAAMMFAGASLATRFIRQDDPLPFALLALAAAALGAFYLASSVPVTLRWLGAAFMAIAAIVATFIAGKEARNKTIQGLIPYARVWVIASLIYFAILGLATNGVGHWGPNYRFWPATWSSDNELPWIFAEAIRRGWDLQGLFGGGWMPTDRPPLMAGAHLLLADVFGWMQSGNDGTYLRGQAYNAAAIALNALWIPACLWLLTTLRRELDHGRRVAILLLVASLPFALFNTIYGWPKAFGATFSLVAFGMAWQSHEIKSAKSSRMTIVIFFVLGAFSMLAHASTALFLLPLGLLFLWRSWRGNVGSILIGLAIALALMASWSLFKVLVLPSADPVTKYALTGDYGFGHPDHSLWQMLSARYGALDFWQWLEIKKIMLFQAFLPLNHPVTQIGLNSDFGAGAIDKLRAWDFMLLSKGNLAIPVFVVIAAWVAVRAFVLRQESQLENLTPFLALIAVSLVAWLLMVIGFLVPTVLHHWPQAAVLGLALGGAVVVHDRYPLIFNLMLLAVMAYMGLVWILSPLQSALGIDAGASLLLVALAAWAWMSKSFHMSFDIGGFAHKNTSSVSLSAVITALRENDTVQRMGNAAIWVYALRILAVGAFLFCSFIALRYIHQPLVDAQAFRQTQTALTAYWMLKEGAALAYQTPVAGYPWSIPFEFPIYQTLVAAITAISGFDLGAVGRFISFLFLIACAWPAFALSKRLSLPASVPWVFCILLWTSPMNVYWGRTFMIETAALFFTLACLPYALDLIRRDGGWRSVLFFLCFATAAVLQKATTGGPVLLFLFLAAVFVQLRQNGLNLLTVRNALYPVVMICIPLIIGLAWAHYADVVKMANPFGSQLTSKALGQWNFGTAQQKLDPETWRLVVWERAIGWNAGGLIGAILLILPWLGGRDYRRFAWLSLAALALFLLPVLIFTNLHFVHEYYQVACVAFLLGALAIVIGGWLYQATGTMLIVPVVTLVIVLSNLVFFSKSYGVVAARDIDELDPRSVQSYKVGRYLRDVTQPGSGLVVFGNDYSSEIAFQAQRKTMAAPPWFRNYSDLWVHPQKYLGDTELAAIVICPNSDVFPIIKGFPELSDLNQRLAKEPYWIHRRVHGCELLLSPKTLLSKE